MKAVADKNPSGSFWLSAKFNHVRQLALKIRLFGVQRSLFWSDSSEGPESCEWVEKSAGL